MVAEETPEARAETIFKIMDLNSDGRITRLYERRQTQIKRQKKKDKEKVPIFKILHPSLDVRWEDHQVILQRTKTSSI